MNAYKLPVKKDMGPDLVKSVMFRLPVDLLIPFNEALGVSGISAQLLVESMVKHCLEEARAQKEFQRTLKK